MRNKVNLQKENDNLYLPEEVEIMEAVNFTEKERYFKVKLLSGKSLGHVPGQFIQLSIMGMGECPMSISSPPSKDNTFEICVRAVGDVTNKLHSLKVGDKFHVRGPFGHGYQDDIIAKMQNKHLLFIVGGTGYAPLRSLIRKVIPEKDSYKKITVLYGYKSPKERLYGHENDEMYKIGDNVELLETVDHSDETWKGNVGVITTLIPKIEFDPNSTIAAIAGPPVMYKFVIKSLLDKGISKDNIYMSLERRMKCGIGKCGHCQMGDIYVCQEGSVFNYADIESNDEVF